MTRHLTYTPNFTTLIYFFILSKLSSVSSKACESFFPCEVDADCWNGPGFRCADVADENGDPLPKPMRLCVCGGPVNITEPDGIPRQFFCAAIRKSFYRSNVLQCLIQSGSPCWPIHERIDATILYQGLPRHKETTLRRSFMFQRDYLCGSGQCLEVKDEGEYDICKVLPKEISVEKNTSSIRG